MGVILENELTENELFGNGLGDILAEIPAEQVGGLEEKKIDYKVVGTVSREAAFVYGGVRISLHDALPISAECVFPWKRHWRHGLPGWKRYMQPKR